MSTKKKSHDLATFLLHTFTKFEQCNKKKKWGSTLYPLEV